MLYVVSCLHTQFNGDEGHLRDVRPEHPVLCVQNAEKSSAKQISSKGHGAELWTYPSN